MVVFHRFMVDWGVGVGYIWHEYMCIFHYVKLIQCSGVPEMYGQWGGYICHGYMCILLYVKLIWCSGVPEVYGWLLGVQWHSNNNKNNKKWINVYKLWNLFVHISIVVTLSCCCSCSACLALGMSQFLMSSYCLGVVGLCTLGLD